MVPRRLLPRTLRQSVRRRKRRQQRRQMLLLRLPREQGGAGQLSAQSPVGESNEPLDRISQRETERDVMNQPLMSWAACTVFVFLSGCDLEPLFQCTTGTN